jgi:hypothetical protein
VKLNCRSFRIQPRSIEFDPIVRSIVSQSKDAIIISFTREEFTDNAQFTESRVKEISEKSNNDPIKAQSIQERTSLQVIPAGICITVRLHQSKYGITPAV